MSRFYSLMALAVIVALAIPTTAAAKDGKYTDKTGRFGIGYDESLASVGGLSARFQVAEAFGIQGIIAFDRIGVDVLNSSDSATASRTQNSAQFALRGDISLAVTRQASLGLVIGANIFRDSFSQEPANNTAGVENIDESQTRFAFEAGIKAEYHFTDWFSVHGEAGFVFAFVSRLTEISSLYTDAGANIDQVTNGTTTEVEGDNADGTVLRFGVGEAVGNFGFTFWF
ncbi:MAG: hypothetical protein CMH57_04030 [Myxococcales bacterium]|nr:hypothetical protein [Myxococcales bacterium]